MATEAPVNLSAAEKSLSSSLMRVNHVGEICAQALYSAQALMTRDPALREKFNAAKKEEEAKKLAPLCFPSDIHEMRSKELHDVVMRLHKCGESTAYARISDMELHKFVSSRKEGRSIYYTLNPELRPPADPQNTLLLG